MYPSQQTFLLWRFRQHHICNNLMHFVATTLKIARLVYVYNGKTCNCLNTFLNEINMDFVASLVSPGPRWLKAFISTKKRHKNIVKWMLRYADLLCLLTFFTQVFTDLLIIWVNYLINSISLIENIEMT